MKHIFFAVVVLFIAAGSSSAFAKEAHSKMKHVTISFSVNDTRRLPASVDEREVMAAQARHVAKDKSLDEAIENLF